MQFLLRHRTMFLLSLGITLLYFFLRLPFISTLPIFTDEAIYVRWAQIAFHDSSWRFISLTDGKQPSFVWAAMVFMKFFHDPLVAGRLVSVASGFGTLIGVWFLTNELFKNKYVGFLCSFLYVCFPFAQVYDRMALYDSMVGMFYVWALYFSILLVRTTRLDIAYTLGFLVGGGILTKSTNFFSIYLLPTTLLLFDWRKQNRNSRLFRWGLLAVFVILLAQLLYSVLRLSPLFHMVVIKNATFVYPFSEWIQHPFIHFVSNTKGLVLWLFAYLKPTYLFLILASGFYFRQYQKEKIVLVLYFLLPFAALIVFGRTIFPRFIFFMSLALLPLAAVSLYSIALSAGRFFSKNLRMSQSTGGLITIGVFTFYSAFVSLQFAYDPQALS